MADSIDQTLPKTAACDAQTEIATQGENIGINITIRRDRDIEKLTFWICLDIDWRQ